MAQINGLVILNNPRINENVAMTVTSTNLDLVDDIDFLLDIWEKQRPIPMTWAGAAGTSTNGGYAANGIRASVNTSATASSNGILRNNAVMLGSSGANLNFMDFSKRTKIIFDVGRTASDAQVVGYFQIKGATTIGVAATKCLGLKFVNYEMWTETYGTALGNIDLAVAVTSTYQYRVKIDHQPAVPKVDYYVDSGAGFVLKATESTSANIPQAVDTNGTQILLTIANGVGGGTDCLLYCGPVLIFQYTT
jgi:hypothetical protein